MKKQKSWNLIGFIVGVAAILAGIIFLATPADSYSTSSVQKASFGGDFYTYEYDATRAAAGNAAVAANNVRELSSKLAQYYGAAFIFAGLLVTVHYGKTCFAVQQEAENRTAEPVTLPNAEQETPGAELPSGAGDE